MDAKQGLGDGMPSTLAGMSKNQLFDIMSQMKTLIEKNKQQARDILIENPMLTRALFQAQIMLGMLQPPLQSPPQMVPNIQPSTPVNPHMAPLSAAMATNQFLTPGGVPDKEKVTHLPVHSNKRPTQPTISSTPTLVRPSSPPPSSHSQQQMMSQAKLNLGGHVDQAPLLPLPTKQLLMTSAPSQPVSSRVISHHRPQLSGSSTQMPPNDIPRPLPPPLHLQHRNPASVPNLPPQQQFRPQVGVNAGFQLHGAPPLGHPSQPMFHPSQKPPGVGVPQFAQGPPPFQSQQISQPYQTTQVGSERGQMWMGGGAPHDGQPLPGQTVFMPGGMMGAPLQGNPARPSPLSQDMEKALLQQVMSLTPHQINLLPPDQRHQVLQLQQMLLHQ